jgi:hypothetical protein
MSDTHTLNGVGAASAIRLTDGWGQEAAAEPRRGIATWVGGSNQMELPPATRPTHRVVRLRTGGR